MSMSLAKTTKFGFQACLDAQAFQVILDETNVQYEKHDMDSLKHIGLSDEECYQEVFIIPKGEELSLVAIDIYNGEFADFELDYLIENSAIH